jgi:predicted aspartyl protease
MGLTSLTISVGNPAYPEATVPVEFLIDSGATYSVVPAAILETLGIKPLTTQEFRLANGARIMRQRGIALFQYKERIGGADVVFGEAGDIALLGATTLESLGYALNPLRRDWEPLPMLLV